MQGRDAELSTLLQAWGSLRTQPRLLAVTVVAEAGVGKSRLLQAFHDTCLPPTRLTYGICHRGRAVPATRGQPFSLLRDILADRCGWTASDTPEAARARFEQALLPCFNRPGGDGAAAAPLHRLGYLVGLGYGDSPPVLNMHGDSRQIRQRGLEAALQLFAQPGADDAPALLQIEDLHWADNESLDFLQQLLDTQPRLPMLLLCSTRAALFERRPGWAGATKPDSANGHSHLRLSLAPLDKEASRSLADALLRPLTPAPPALRELLATSAEGNPFHMEQLVGLLHDAGALRIHGSGWEVDADRLLGTPWPTTLTGVLQARLAALPAEQRRALQQASIIGPDFSGHALQALGGRADRSLPASLTREATSSRVMDDQPGDGSDRRVFSFRHQVLQEAAYNSMPSRSRRALHKRLALWLSGLMGASAGHALGATADHFERAGEASQAAEHHAQAAEHAAVRFAHEAALVHVQRALALLDTLPAQRAVAALRWRLLDRRELTFATLAQRAEQRNAINGLAAFADAMADDRLRAEAACRLANFCNHLGDHNGQRAASRTAVALAQKAGEPRIYLRGLRALSDAYCKLGDWDAGQRLSQQCLELAAAQGDVYAQAQCLNTLALIAAQRQDPVGRLQMHERELVLRRQLPDRRPEAVVLANLGGGWLDLGELFLARQYSEEALRLVRAMGNRQTESAVLCNLSNLERWLGDSAKALTLAEAALAAAADAGSPPWESFALTRVADSHLALGQWADADQAYARAQALAIQIKMPHEHETTAGRARVALAQGQTTTALQHVQGVIDHEAATGVRHGAKNAVRVDLVCHLVLASVGDPRAPDWLLRAHGQLQSIAARIGDPALRRGFLDNIPEHRAVAAAWAVARAEAALPAAPQRGPSDV